MNLENNNSSNRKFSANYRNSTLEHLTTKKVHSNEENHKKVINIYSEYENKILDIKLTKIEVFKEANAFLIIVSDTTEKLRNKSLEESNQYKNELFKSFSHELRTPLNCSYGLLNSLIQNYSINKSLKEKFVSPAFNLLSNRVNNYNNNYNKKNNSSL